MDELVLSREPFPYPESLEFPTWKRTLDLSIAIMILILLLPILLLIVIYIKIVSPGGSIIFKQKRIGFMGRRFEIRYFHIWKFRTMEMET